MRKILNTALASVAALFLFSCEPAEIGSTFNLFYDDIYTVNKHTVTPEDSDSVIRINNMDSTNFTTGDRARMILRHYYDYNVMSKPHIDIYYAGEVIPTYPLSSKDSIDVSHYTTPFDSLYYYEFIDRYRIPVWVQKGRQNINISYFGAKEGAEFAMTVRGVNDDCVELDLLAKADGDVKTTRLLTFDISNIGDFLTSAQKSSFASKDSLRTRIYLKRKTKDGIKEINIIGGKFANPFK